MDTLLNHLAQSIAENPFLAYLELSLGGINTSSNLRILATIPLVIGYVGGYAEGDRRKAFVYSLTFIFGLSITFTVLGAMASLMGGLFGMVNRTWYFVVGGVAVLIGLHLVGLFRWNILVAVQLQPKRTGLLGAFILGLLFGVVSSPCATPVLVSVLTLVAAKSEVAYGTRSSLFMHCALIFWRERQRVSLKALRNRRESRI